MKWTIIAVIASVIVVFALGFVFFSSYKTMKAGPITEETEIVIEEAPETKEKPKQEIILEPDKIENIVQKYDKISELPKKTSFLISFLDGNGNQRPERFLLIGKGEVVKYDGRDVDGEIIIPDYWIPEFEKADDLCDVVKKMKDSNDYVIKKHASLAKILFRYSGLKSMIEECAG